MLPNGARVILRSVVIILIFSVVVDNLGPLVPDGGISDERMLNALFGGITGGIGVGSGLSRRRDLRRHLDAGADFAAALWLSP